MRRSTVAALATATLAAGLLGGVVESANAAKPLPPFALQAITVAPTRPRTVAFVTLQWAPSEPERVESYLVQANNAPLKGKNTVQGNVITETSSSWEIDDNSPFYVDVTINYLDGKPSKAWSVGNTSWDCIG